MVEEGEDLGVGVLLTEFVDTDVGGAVGGAVDGEDVGDGLGAVSWWLVHGYLRWI